MKYIAIIGYHSTNPITFEFGTTNPNFNSGDTNKTLANIKGKFEVRNMSANIVETIYYLMPMI